MKKHIFVLLSAVLLGGMCGCVQKSSSAQYMTFDTVLCRWISLCGGTDRKQRTGI